MANDKNLKGVYETLKKEGYAPPAFDEFVKDMQDDENLRGVHATLTKSGYTPPEYGQFRIDMLGNSAVSQPQQGKPVQPQPTTQPQATATETSTPQQTAQQPVSTPAPAPQPTWQPTEQEKIQMSYWLNSMMSDFNARSRARVEQARRVAERNTPEGRRKLKAAKFQAQLAGTPTQVMGLTPDVSASPSGDGQGATGEQAKPLLSGQGPVPYGVVEVDGKRKTQWLLPDGTLTTDFMEADKAEYGARRVRLMNQFVGRMKENGLDPSKQEDVQRQAQLDYEAPIRKAVAAAVQADDERSDKEQEAYMSNPLNMVGGVNAALGHAAARKQAGIGDLSLIAENAYNSLPSAYRRDLIASYTDYFTQHPEDTHGKTIEQAATDAAKSVVYGQVHEEYVKRNGPQSNNEFFLRKMLELNPASVALSSTINPRGQAYAELDAMERYGAEHRGLDIAGTVAGMAIDPTTYLGGWAGNIAFKNATRAAGKVMAKKALGDVAGRYATTTLAGRIIGGMAAGGANFGTFEAVKDAERQLYQGGYLNPKTGEMEGFSFGSVLNSGVHGIGMGAATGVVSPLIGNVADKAVKATTSTAGKAAMRGTEVLASTLAEGTVFSIPEWISGDQDAFDVWTDNMAMMAGFKLSHTIKTAPAMIRSLQPVKPTGDRPLSREERIHNNKSFAERLRERLDQSPSDIAMSREEREELKRKGYGDLSDLFVYDPEHKSRKVNAAQKEEGDYTGVTGLSRAVDYEPTLDETGNPTFDGYEVMERLMEDENVSEATRAKAYYLLTGRMLPMSTVTGWSREDNEDGTITITSHSNQGNIVTSRSFSGEKEAQMEIDRIERQSELNTIDIGEQYRNAEAQQRVMEAAIQEVSPGADPQTVYNIYEAARRGDKNVTEEQHHLADMIDEAIERNSSAGDDVRPEGIRERVSEETGVDIDKAIRKEPGKRTEAEREAVKRYARELFPEPEAYEPTPEEAEADRVYEESRLLFGRFEQGDPEAQAEIDAISLRMTEAHQLCEDAFGDEAEVYMAEIKENPWGILNDPELTPDQKDAVLYYINANAALDGVLDASNEAAADKRQRVQGEVARRTHKERGVIVPATMKMDDKPVYIINGEVAMFPDGSGVDVGSSSDSVIILDESGEYKFTSPDQIMSVGETIDPQIELQTAYDAIDREQEAIISTATDGVPESPEIVLNSGENEGITSETAEETPQSVPNVEEYDRGYEEGTQIATTLDDNILNTAIDDLRGRDFLTDEWRGRLEAYEYEQQRRTMEGSQEGNNPAQNIPDNNPAGETAPSALERIPVDEQTGDPILTHESVDADTAWDAAIEFFGTPEDALSYVQAEVNNAKSAITTAEKAVSKVKPTGGMIKYRDELKAARDKVEAAKGTLAKWQAIEEVQKRRISEERAKDEKEQALANAEAEATAKAEAEQEALWKARRAKLDRRVKETADIVRDHPEALEILSNMEPTDIYELAATMLQDARLIADDATHKGFAQEMGSNQQNERKKFFGLFASKEKGGVTIQHLAEKMTAEMERLGMQGDSQDARNAILEIISQSTTRGDFFSYIPDRRIRQAMELYEHEREMTDQEEREYEDMLHRERFGYGLDEAEAYEEARMEMLAGQDLDFDEQEFYANFADEIHDQRSTINDELSRINDKGTENVTTYGREESEGSGEAGEGEGSVEEGTGALQGTEREGTGPASGGVHEILREEDALHTERAGEAGDGRAVPERDGDGIDVAEDGLSGSASGRGLTTDDQGSGISDERSIVNEDIESGAEAPVQQQIATAEVRDINKKSGISARIAEAEAEVNTEPSEAQKEAGNYRKGHVKVEGFDVTIEQPKGSVRRGADASGKKWESRMNHTYGYIRGTEGVDGDHIDVFLSDTPEEGNVYVVDQYEPDGTFDEHKVMYGFPDAEAARSAYLSNYEKGWDKTRRIDVTGVTKEDFKKWIQSSRRKTKPFAEYSSVRPIEEAPTIDEDSQPLSREDYREALARISPKQGKVDDEMRDMEDELRSLLGIDDSEGDRGDLFRNPEEFTNKERMQITSLGITYALKYFDQGIVSFPEFADKMVRRMGEKIRPWLKAFYGGARAIPGYDHLPFTASEEVKAFDVMNFDKANKDSDPMRLAQGIVTEARAQSAVSEAQREIKDLRNRKRKEGESITKSESDKIIEILRGGKSAPKREVKPGQTVGDLFSGLFDEPINSNEQKKTELPSRTGTGEREGGHESRQDEPLGTGQRNETSGPDGRGMAGRGGDNIVPDTSGGDRVSGSPTEHAVKPSAGKDRKKTISQKQERLPKGERKNARNNRAERGKDYAPKGVDARIKANIKAIELAQELLESGAIATPEQMGILRQFSGWGGLGKAFSDDGYSMQIKKLLGDAYQDAVDSRKSAYYTPAYIIDTMWDIARAMGFNGGNVLEGSAGIGNILGLMPEDMSDRSNIHAVEVDRTTGGMLSLLYPDAKVDIQGFEATKIPNGSVDLSITNVPFITGWNVADTSGDKDLSRKFRDIHDFCIAKNVRKLKPGGIGIFITSSGTLDNSDKLRAWLTNEGASDVVGAFRMNNQTFGGTGATSDIIVVRKRINGQKSPHAIDVSEVTGARVADYDTGDVKRENGKEVPVIKSYPMSYNKYFFEHPENMAGEMMFNFEKGETFQPTSRALFPANGKDQGAMLKDWAARFSEMDFEASPEDNPAYAPTYDAVGNEVKTGSMIVDSQGRLCTNMNGIAIPVMGSTPTGYSKMTPEQRAKVDAERVDKFNRSKIKGRTRQQCLKDYNELKKALAEVLQYQTDHADNEGLEPLLKKLNQTFDRFVSLYGNLHKNTQLAWLRNDVDYPSILALESFDERPNAQGERIRTFGKTDIFSRRVVEKEIVPKPENVKDGIIASIYMNGRIDLPYISEALGRSPEDVKKEIISSGLGFENPNTTELEVSYEYLSGNVREKLHQAQDNNVDGKYSPNIKALERVIPMNIPAHLIEFTLGSSWITPKLYEDFIKERTGVSVKLKNTGGTWFVGTPDNGTNTELNRSQGVFSEMFKSTIFGHQLMEAAITNRSITVSRTYKHSDGTSETVTDKDATQACAAKIDEIRQDFKDWARQRMQQDPEMSAEMERVYNEKFNNYVAREIPEEFIPEHFGGAAHIVNGKPFKLRLHQAKAVIRGTMQSQLLAHEVGTGKTYTLISTAMEMRRLGTARKPMIVVQNATVGQFVESAKALYPNARILTIEEADRTAEGRKNFYAKIKYNDWDMIVVPQSVFERIPDSEERQIKFIQDKIEEKLKVLEDMKEEDPDGSSMVVRQAEAEIEKSREELNKITQALEEKRGKKKEKDEKREAQTRHNAEVRAMEMLDRETDDVENFDEMGIDAILVDEAHEYKHLGFSTAMQRGVKGIDPSYSKKAQGVYLKTLAVKERNNGRNVIFATGTPISNTAAEIWTFMRFLLDPDMMKEYGIYYFDDFVRNFGNLQQMLEFTTSGKFKENNRFAGYVNLPELVRIWSGAADTVLTREAGGVNDKIPKMEGDKAQDIYLPQTRALRSVMLFVKSELDRYENMTGKEKKKNSHIPLVMYGLAKAAAVDARLVVAGAEDDPNSKTNEAVRQTLKSLKETESYKGTVAIFADNYQNKKSGFNLYEDIRQKLIDKGVPADQIVVMRSDMTVKKKLDIFDRVNRGEVRVIMGSAFTLGTGVNIQERLHTLIHVDAPNRPMDYTQRNGRILRQGNLHKEMGLPVRVLRFGVEDSLDVTAYQRLKTKGAIADSIMNGKELISNAMENRSMEEDEDVFGDITAQLSGSEYAMLKNQAEKQVRKYTSKLKQWEAQQTHIHNQLPRLKGQIKASEQRREEAQKHLEVIGTGRDGKITIGTTTYPNIDAMADLFTEHNKRVKAAQDEVREGSGERTMTMNVNVGGIDFTINTRVSRKIANNGQLSFESERNMKYSCEALGMEDVPVSGSRLKAAIEDIIGNVMNGNLFRERIETANNSIERMNNEVSQLESQKGKPFEHVKELEEAERRLEEYTEKMKAELAEKEAKYADIDATVEAAEDVYINEDDEEGISESTEEPGNPYAIQRSLFDEEDFKPVVRIKPDISETPAEREAVIRAEIANEAIDRHADQYMSISGSYESLIDKAKEEGNESLARGLEERMLSELEKADEELELRLTDYYHSEGNSDEDSSRMARDMSARVRADIRLRGDVNVLSGLRKQTSQASLAEKNVQESETAGGEKIEFSSLPAEKDTPRLPRLKKGEFTIVERTFTETGEFGFTGKERIETLDDVAYIFRSLENYSIENTFAMLVKDGRPLIVHTGMGTAGMSMMDMAAVRGAYDEYGADEIYIVHNHPSGNLNSSPQDAALLKTAQEMFDPGVVKDGIIIDVTSGRYSTFGTTGSSIEAISGVPDREITHNAKRFNRKNPELKKIFDSTEPTIIRSSGDVARYVADKRLGRGRKISFLLLSQRNQVTGNFITDYETYNGNEEAIAEDMVRMATRYGAKYVMPFGNAKLNGGPIKKMSQTVEKKSGKTIRMLDALCIENGLADNYESANDSGVLEVVEPYGRQRSTINDQRSWSGASSDDKPADADVDIASGAIEEAAINLGERLHSPIRVISRKEAEAEGYRRKKGWYDRATGEITIVADNHRNVGDIVDTAMHEAVGHHGLRQLFGTEEKLNNFLDEAYNISSSKIREEIDRRAQRMMDNESDRLREQKRKAREAEGENADSHYYEDMASARTETYERREQIRRDATEEYAADLGMKIGEEGFERMDAEELTFWGKIKGLLQKALDRLLAGLKLPKMRRWTDKEWSYVLWRSWRNLRGQRSTMNDERSMIRLQGPLAEAEDIVMRERMLFNADPLIEKTPKRERIAKLRRSQPVEITGEEFEYSEDLKQHKRNALEYGKRLQGEYRNEDTGKTIRLQRGRRNGGLKEVLQHDLSDAAHIKSVAAIPDIIRKSIYIETEPNHDKEKNPGVEGYEHYVCGLKIGGEDYTVHSIVAEDRQGNRYYDHKLSRIEKGKLLDFIEAKQPMEGILTPTSGTEPTIRSERKVKELISILQVSDGEKRYLFRDGDLGLEEAITKMKAEAAAANGADFKAKQEAMRAIGGNLSKLRQAMARQREYDITTVKSMTDLSKILLDGRLLDDLSKYETKRILSSIKEAVGREDTSKQVQRLMDIMVDNQLRMGANYFGKLLSVKGSRVDARGIEVQGELDPDGQKIAQTVRRATTRTLDDIENMMAEAMNRMSSADQAATDEATLEYAGLQIAHQYAEEIRESKNEEKDLSASIKDAHEEYKQGNMTHAAYLQYKAATEDAIRQNKIERAEAYRSLSERLGGVLGESVGRAKAWRQEQKARIEEIHHNANSDMEGRPTNEHHKADRLQKFVNNGLLRFVLAPLGTFDQMLRMFGRKSVRGEGYLWNRFMRGWVDCTEKEYIGYQEALKSLDKKVSEVFGKDMKWGDLFAMERKMPKASVRFWDGGEMRDHELTQGNLIYIYMTDKMTDGRMKLRRMGITEADVERIKNFVDPRMIQLADWMQEEFLTEKRNGYNEVHKRMFGTSMAAIENYFPLKILANARMEDVDLADDTGDNILPATSTGSIIKRKRNNLALDVTGADAFSVILDHIQQMERWAAFAEYNRDLNTLLSYKRFRNQVMNMTSAYGAGKTLWTNFRNVASMAAGAYRPPIAPLDKAAVNVAKGVTAAKVSFRVFTALKQFLSMPAYVSDSNPIYLVDNILSPQDAWWWAMENLPIFEKRWKSRMAGDPRLLKSDMDWKMWRSRVVEIAGRVGMSPNAFVDALTVAIGARSMYQTKLAKYKRQGYSPEHARKRARQDATILFNQTQQSSEGAFLSTMQVDRSWLSVLFTVFRNSSMSYTRQLYDAMRNIGHRLTPGYKGITEEFMAKQMRRDGIDPDKADQNAKQEYRRGLIRDIVRIGIFGYALQFAWNLGAYLPYLLFGKNADEKDKMWEDVLNHSMFGSVEGLTGGDVMSAAGEMWLNGEGNPEQLTKDMPLASDVVSILRKMDKDYVSAMNDVVNLLVQSGLGFNPQSLTDAAVAVMDYCGEDAKTSHECALLISRIINCPQSQIDKIYFDEIGMSGEEISSIPKDKLPELIAERYARYKVRRNAPLTGFIRTGEDKEEALEKQRTKARKAIKKRVSSHLDTERTRELLKEAEETAAQIKKIRRLRERDEDRYDELMAELEESPAYERYVAVREYNNDFKDLYKDFQNAKTTEEADSIIRLMVEARDRLLEETETPSASASAQ